MADGIEERLGQNFRAERHVVLRRRTLEHRQGLRGITDAEIDPGCSAGSTVLVGHLRQSTDDLTRLWSATGLAICIAEHAERERVRRVQLQRGLELLDRLRHAVAVELDRTRHHARDEERRVEIEGMTNRRLGLCVAFGDAEGESIRAVRDGRERIELRGTTQLRYRLVDASVDEQHLPVPLMSGCVIRVERERALIVALGLAPPPANTEQIRS